MSPETSKPITGRRTVCDHCRRRSKSPLFLHSDHQSTAPQPPLRQLALPTSVVQLHLSLSTDHHILKEFAAMGSSLVTSAVMQH